VPLPSFLFYDHITDLGAVTNLFIFIHNIRRKNPKSKSFFHLSSYLYIFFEKKQKIMFFVNKIWKIDEKCYIDGEDKKNNKKTIRLCSLQK
jgi:hypothetical protein